MEARNLRKERTGAVSYTHLDVYKRQGVADRTHGRSKSGAKRPKAGQAAAPAKGKGKKMCIRDSNNRLKRLIEIKAPEVILRNEKRMLQMCIRDRCTPDAEAAAKEAGADYVGLDEYIEKIKGGWTDIDEIGRASCRERV